MKLEEEEKKLELELIEFATQNDSKKIQERSQRLGMVKKRVDEAFEELSSVTISHDNIFKSYEDKLKEVEGVLMPLISKAYQSNAPPQQSETSATSDLD
jgi:hypothetical protein